MFHVVWVVNLLSAELRVVGVDDRLDLWGLEGGFNIYQVGSVAEYLVEQRYFCGFLADGDRAESVVKMGEDVGDGVGVVNFDEIECGLYAVVEAVEVEEVDWLLSVVVVEFGDLAGA